MTRDDYLKIAVAAVASGVVGAFFKKLFEILPTGVSLSGFLALTLFVALAWRTFERLEGREKEAGSDERARFEAFRQDLVDGGTPARVYNLWLGRMLDAVDRFFGDAGRADRSWVARLMRLETPGPRWTAVAYDRCLLLALLYPIAVVFVVWVISGRVGPAEAALGLRESAAGWTWDTAKRGAALLSLFAMAVTIVGFFNAEGRTLLFWGIAFPITVTGAVVGVGDAVGGLGLVIGAIGAGVGAGVVGGAGAVFGAVAVIVVAIVFDAIVGNVALAIVAGVSVAGAAAWIFIVDALSKYFTDRNRFGTFIFLHFITTFVVISGLSSTNIPHDTDSLLLFFSLLTLINAPIDWLALGFTRALLRKGLVKSGWWPFGFALVDLAVAAVLVAGLAFVLVFAVQFFDDMAALGGGPEARILPLRPLFARLHDAPTAYEVWWVWAMLFSSMIPSFVNLTIAAAAFLRGLPAVHARVLARLEPNRALGTWDRIGLAATLAGQVVIGGMLAIGVFYLAAMVVLPMVLPAFAHLLLTFADGLAEADLPAQMIDVFRHW